MTIDFPIVPAAPIAAPAAPPAIEPAVDVMPVATEPAAVAALELTPPGISHEATSGNKADDVGTHQHSHGVHAVGADALKPQRSDLRPGVDRPVQQVVISHQVLLQVIQQNEVDIVQAHIGYEAPTTRGKGISTSTGSMPNSTAAQGKGRT